jgi:hypothetical protein
MILSLNLRTFSERLVLFPTRQDLSQENAARMLGIDPDTWISGETGREKPSKDSVRLLTRNAIL